MPLGVNASHVFYAHIPTENGDKPWNWCVLLSNVILFAMDGGAVKNYEITLQIFGNAHLKWKKINQNYHLVAHIKPVNGQPCMPHRQALFVRTAVK